MSTDTGVTQVLPPPPPAPEQNGGGDPAVSILSGLRKEHAETRAARTKVFVIPGFEDRPTPLACRYGVIPYEEQTKISARLGTDMAVSARDDGDLDPYRLLNHWVDQLVLACREFGVMQGDEFVPLDADRPVRWGSPRLLTGLGITLEGEQVGARDRLKAVFRSEHGDEEYQYAIEDHHTEVIDGWMLGGRRRKGPGAAADADEEFAKNS